LANRAGRGGYIPNSLWTVVVIAALACGFGVVNGFNDAANAIATVIGTRALSPRNAIILATVFNFIGSAGGLAVARTIGKGILAPEAISHEVAVAALLSIIIWGAVATYRGLPISLHHGFISGLAGAGLAILGAGAIVWDVMLPVLAAVVIAPLLGFLGGYIAMVALYWIFRRSTPAKVGGLFRRLQILSASFVSYTHGLNDGQMPIGVMLMTLAIYTGNADIWNSAPWWVIFFSALSMGLGTALGGWRVIKTLGTSITNLHPVQGFAAEFSSALVVWIASLFGIPVSTTHNISASIFGVGCVTRVQAVHWGMASNIIAAWVFTFPLCGALGYIIGFILKLIFR
jgi:PiT family inorganic phosphate transporter